MFLKKLSWSFNRSFLNRFSENETVWSSVISRVSLWLAVVLLNVSLSCKCLCIQRTVFPWKETRSETHSHTLFLLHTPTGSVNYQTSLLAMQIITARLQPAPALLCILLRGFTVCCSSRVSLTWSELSWKTCEWSFESFCLWVCVVLSEDGSIAAAVPMIRTHRRVTRGVCSHRMETKIQVYNKKYATKQRKTLVSHFITDVYIMLFSRYSSSATNSSFMSEKHPERPVFLCICGSV